MKTTPKSLRLHIGLFGRRNVGKSSLINALCHQEVSIVSPVAGTTTDLVEKPMELQPIGPVVFMDTAGIDDVGDLGGKRVARTRQAMKRCDLALLVMADNAFGQPERDLLDDFARQNTPALLVINKCDATAPDARLLAELDRYDLPLLQTSIPDLASIDALRTAITESVDPALLAQPPIIGDLIHDGKVVVLVTPIDREAPKGRLILPEAQTLRDALDHQGISLVVQVPELAAALAMLNAPPDLVVTDSQAFKEVAEIVPESIPLTSFSILFARFKGDLDTLAVGADAIGHLENGARVLIAEACTHHPIEDDIGTIKLPRLLKMRTGKDLQFTHVRGHDFPADVGDFELVIHCGACMITRREVLGRLQKLDAHGVPVTNYGVAIAYCLGILPRALQPFM